MFRRNVLRPSTGSHLMAVDEVPELANRPVTKRQLLSPFLSQRPVSDLTAYLLN